MASILDMNSLWYKISYRKTSYCQYKSKYVQWFLVEYICKSWKIVIDSPHQVLCWTLLWSHNGCDELSMLQLHSLKYMETGITLFAEYCSVSYKATYTDSDLKTFQCQSSRLWMALFSWVPIFVDWTKITHSWGSKFVAIEFYLMIHKENWTFVGTGIRRSDPPRKPRKI